MIEYNFFEPDLLLKSYFLSDELLFDAYCKKYAESRHQVLYLLNNVYNLLVLRLNIFYVSTVDFEQRLGCNNI